MENPWLLFLFLSVFHVIGAAVLANALRELMNGLRAKEPQGCRATFLAVWAVMFGCFPFGFGISFAGAETGPPLLLIGEVLVWAAAFLTTLLVREALGQFLEPFLYPETLLMLFGGGFVVAGVGMASLMTKEGSGGLLVGGVVILAGAAVFGYGLWRLFKSTR
jgi:hypothetical protein